MSTLLGQQKFDAPHAIIANQGAGVGFSQVSKYWTAKCMSFKQGKAKLADQQSHIQDFRTPLALWEVNPTDTGIVFRNKENGRDYIPTDHALGLMCQVGKGMSDWTLRALREPIRHATKVDPSNEELKLPLYERSRVDFSVLADYIRIHLFQPDRVDQNKPRLWRTWDDGTLRAFLSTQYAIVNNGWFLDLLETLLPGGLLSHWNGDADSIYGNILMPDSIRAEKDSDYGGMLSIGNSEIGLRRISSLPSVFRAICMNGCIWEQEEGEEYNKRHRGQIDFAQLALEIQANITKQIPLLTTGIDKVLGLRAFGIGDTPLQNLFAQLAIDNSIGKKEIAGVQEAFWKEVKIVGKDEGFTAFGLMNGLTRFGQTREAASWVAYDMLGGSIANMDRNNWDRFRSRAANLSDKQVEKRFAVSV